MKVLIAGVCGFVGSTLARAFVETDSTMTVIGIDNLSRIGSETNRARLRSLGIQVIHGDTRQVSDLERLPRVHWLIDAAANPSVLAGTDGRISSRQLVENNLFGTVNLLELCRERETGFILLSSSRVYSIEQLRSLSLEILDGAFHPLAGGSTPAGMSPRGVSESFSTSPPLSLYGSSKLASETLALEYGQTFGFPVWINRCGLMAGAGQFGRSDQGVVTFWIHAWLRRLPLMYIGFGGHGAQVRDCLHPRDLAPLLMKQMTHEPTKSIQQTINISGGLDQAISLAQLSTWCERRFGRHHIDADLTDRAVDVPWLVLDSSKASEAWNWRPTTSLETILEEIAAHAERNPHWIDQAANP